MIKRVSSFLIPSIATVLALSLNFFSESAAAQVSNRIREVKFDGTYVHLLLPRAEADALLEKVTGELGRTDLELVPLFEQMNDVHPLRLIAGTTSPISSSTSKSAPKTSEVWSVIPNVRHKPSGQIFSLVTSVLSSNRKSIPRQFTDLVTIAQFTSAENSLQARRFILDVFRIEHLELPTVSEQVLRTNLSFLKTLEQPLLVVSANGDAKCVSRQTSLASDMPKVSAVRTSGSIGRGFPKTIARDFLSRHLGETPIGSFQTSSNWTEDALSTCW